VRVLCFVFLSRPVQMVYSESFREPHKLPGAFLCNCLQAVIMDETKINSEEAAPAFVDLLIIGGPKTDAPPRCSRSFLQVPFTLTGLADARPLVPEANIIVYWPDRSIFEIPTAEACMRFDEFDIVARMYPKGEWQVTLSKWLVDIQSNPKALDTLHDLIGRALRNVMAPAFEAVRAGFAVIIVVPADFPDWEHPANGVFQWFSKYLHSYKKKHRRTPKAVPFSGDAFLERLVDAHTSWIRDWPLCFSMRTEELLHPDMANMDFMTTDAEIFNIYRDTVDDAIDVKVCAATRDRTGIPTSLSVQYGRGGFLVIPPPQDNYWFFDIIWGEIERQPSPLSADTGGVRADVNEDKCDEEPTAKLSSMLPDKATLDEWHKILGLTSNDNRRGPIENLEILAHTLDSLPGERQNSHTEIEICGPHANGGCEAISRTGEAIRSRIKEWSKKADPDTDLRQFLDEAKRTWKLHFLQQ